MLQQVWLPPNFLPKHRRITLDYLYKSHMFRGNDWREILVAIDILKKALVLLPSGWVPFCAKVNFGDLSIAKKSKLVMPIGLFLSCIKLIIFRKTVEQDGQRLLKELRLS